MSTDSISRNAPPAPPTDLVESYWRDIRHFEPLSRQQETELVRRARGGDQAAVDALVTANLRFVVTVAKKYSSYGLSFSELIAEGNCGLMEAVKRFDETRGFKFITYAVWWIRQAILKALAENRRVARPPMSQVNDLQKIERTSATLTQRLGRAPTPEEIARAADMSLDRAHNALALSQSDLSLDAPLGDEAGDESLLGVLHSEAPGLDESVEQGDLYRALNRCLEELDDREQLILRAYFGLLEAEPLTLEQIGELLGLTRERVRQLRYRALARVRANHGDLLLELSSN